MNKYEVAVNYAQIKQLQQAWHLTHWISDAALQVIQVPAITRWHNLQINTDINFSFHNTVFKLFTIH